MCSSAESSIYFVRPFTVSDRKSGKHKVWETLILKLITLTPKILFYLKHTSNLIIIISHIYNQHVLLHFV